MGSAWNGLTSARRCCGCATAVPARAHDDAGRHAGRRIACPTLLLWAEKDDLEDPYGDPLGGVARRGRGPAGRSLNCGHHLAEEVPEELVAEIRAFLAG
jgi:haloacetate dehalogenase